MALVALACAANELKWDEIPVAGNASQCIYRLDASSLSCRSANQSVIECPAVVNIPEDTAQRTRVVGIARTEKVRDDDVKTEAIRYFLYPRIMKNETYLNHKIVVDGKSVDLFLYYSENSTDISGVRIIDLKCYRRLVTLFDASALTSHEVTIDEQKVSLLGEILVAESTQSKRWLGMGLGWGMGWGWGLGWGWPFWGGMWGR
jgi:hypothetical protein